MARTAGAKLGLGLGLLLLLGLRDGPRAARHDDHTLCYNFTVIPKPGPGQPWCEVQGTINGNKFLDYHCGSEKVTPVGPLGMKVNGTDTWRSQSEALRDLVEELRKKLLDIKPQNSTISDPLSLQGRMMCSCKANGCTCRSWQFGFDGQIALFFDSENGYWTPGTMDMVQPEGRLLKGILENDRDITKLFITISKEAQGHWLMQFSEKWEKMPEITASPTTAAALEQSRAMAITPISWIFPVTLTCSILLVLLG